MDSDTAWFLLHTAYTPYFKVVYMALWAMAVDGEAWPGHERLCEVTGMGETCLKKTLNALQDDGLLTVKRPGQGRVNQYTLTPLKVWRSWF